MAPRKNNGSEPVHGVLLLNKPAGVTSNQALQRVKRLLRAKKAGHTGSLDPSATGMLPLCFGEATKVCAFLLEADKSYRVTAKLGIATDTGDADGKITGTQPVPSLPREQWASILESFLGRSEQIPPMYSALKKDGERLYTLARKGLQVEREARSIRVHEVELLELVDTRLVFRVRCSKGTYVRTLVEDMARKAGTLAHTVRLHRESVAGFETEPMIELPVAETLAESGPEALKDRLLAADAALCGMPAVSVDLDSAARFRTGQRVSTGDPASDGLVRVYGPDGSRDFLGVGELAVDGMILPKRVFAPV